MFKTICVVDKESTAIDRLAQAIKPYMQGTEYHIISVHPKRPDQEQLSLFEKLAIDADVIDFQYFRTAMMLLDRYPWLKEKKKILTHHNPYSIFEQNWKEFDFVVANNLTIKKDLEEKVGAYNVEYIPNCIDSNFWTFNDNFKPNKTVIMVANRIESKKGILPVAIACGDLNLDFTLVGSVSDTAYMRDIMQTGSVNFYERISDEQLRNLYWNSTIHVCNSVDNFESGTMPILEAMLCGVPVLTRRIGMVPDIDNGENLKILDCQPEEVEKIAEALEDMINDKKALIELREAGWKTGKNFSAERRAYMYRKLYRRLLEDKPVTIIMPIYDNQDIIRRSLNAIAEQAYKNIELIICDDNPNGLNKELIIEFRKFVNFPVIYINSSSANNDYGLARARNMGIIEATGDVIVFCDQRMHMDKNAVTEFVKELTPRKWVYGNKGGKRDFVENFSAIYRDDIIRAGMFCERINQYGGMSQEVRARTRAQGISHQFIETAKATPLGKSSNKYKKRQEIRAMKDILFKMGL